MLNLGLSSLRAATAFRPFASVSPGAALHQLVAARYSMGLCKEGLRPFTRAHAKADTAQRFSGASQSIFFATTTTASLLVAPLDLFIGTSRDQPGLHSSLYGASERFALPRRLVPVRHAFDVGLLGAMQGAVSLVGYVVGTFVGGAMGVVGSIPVVLWHAATRPAAARPTAGEWMRSAIEQASKTGGDVGSATLGILIGLPAEGARLATGALKVACVVVGAFVGAAVVVGASPVCLFAAMASSNGANTQWQSPAPGSRPRQINGHHTRYATFSPGQGYANDLESQRTSGHFFRKESQGARQTDVDNLWSRKRGEIPSRGHMFGQTHFTTADAPLFSNTWRSDSSFCYDRHSFAHAYASDNGNIRFHFYSTTFRTAGPGSSSSQKSFSTQNSEKFFTPPFLSSQRGQTRRDDRGFPDTAAFDPSASQREPQRARSKAYERKPSPPRLATQEPRSNSAHLRERMPPAHSIASFAWLTTSAENCAWLNHMLLAIIALPNHASTTSMPTLLRSLIEDPAFSSNQGDIENRLNSFIGKNTSSCLTQNIKQAAVSDFEKITAAAFVGANQDERKPSFKRLVIKTMLRLHPDKQTGAFQQALTEKQKERLTQVHRTVDALHKLYQLVS